LSAVLLLHGQPGSARDWDRVLDALGRGADVLAVDRPGWDGRSHATDLAGNAAAAIAALDAHQISRAAVVGHSFGGAVAAWLAVHHPERLTALILAAPSANGRAMYALDRVLASRSAGGAAVAGAGAALSLPPLRRAIAARADLDELYLRGLARMLTRPSSWEAFVIEQRALLDGIPQLEPQLHRISTPTVIVAGAADRIVPTAAAELLAQQIPGAELVMLRRAGHLLPHRYGETLAGIITARVRSNS
jgi:3-oxoadipate enol-lactonase / 4-carboxymuconolactone decarboxylase